MDYVYTSNSPYIIFTDYKGIKDVKNYNLPDDEEELVNYICNYLIELNLTEREKSHLMSSLLTLSLNHKKRILMTNTMTLTSIEHFWKM